MAERMRLIDLVEGGARRSPHPERRVQMTMVRNLSRSTWCGALPVMALLLALSGGAQAVETVASLEWVKQFGGSDRDEGQRIASLPDGSFLMSGYFENTFGSPGNEPATVGLRDVFVAKFTAAGEVVWVKSLGSEHCDVAGDICAMPDGSFAITFSYGYAGAACIVGLGGGPFTWLYPYGEYDVGVARYNADGTLRWAQRAGSNKWDFGEQIALANDGSCYVTAGFSGTSCAFGASDIVLDGPNAFVMRYEADGALAWVKPVHDTSLTTLSDSTCVTEWYEATEAGDTYGIVGYDAGGAEVWRLETSSSGEGAAALCGLPSNREFIMAGMGSPGFVRKYRVEPDNTLTVLWDTKLDGTSLLGSELAVGPDGDCYLLKPGYEPEFFHIECNGHIFFQGALPYHSIDVCASQTDNRCLIAGELSWDTTFGEGQPTETTLTHMGYGDIFVAQYEAGVRHELRLEPRGFGRVILEPPGGCYGEGTEVGVHAVPCLDDHDRFDHWEGDLAGEGWFTTIAVPSGGLESTAVFVELPDAPSLPALSLAGLACLASGLAAVVWRGLRRR